MQFFAYGPYFIGQGFFNVHVHIFQRHRPFQLPLFDVLLHGVEAIDAIFRMRTEHMLNAYRQRVNGTTLDKRLDQLTQLRDADGYMSTWEMRDDGVFILREANCPIIHVAEDCESACSYDHALLTNLLDAEVVRKGHIVRGDGACMYEVKPKEKVTTAE